MVSYQLISCIILLNCVQQTKKKEKKEGKKDNKKKNRKKIVLLL